MRCAFLFLQDPWPQARPESSATSPLRRGTLALGVTTEWPMLLYHLVNALRNNVSIDINYHAVEWIPRNQGCLVESFHFPLPLIRP